MEVCCLGWAQVLLFMVYEFIRRFLRENDLTAPFEIPQMCFVSAALACSQLGVEKDRDLYLLEERIYTSSGMEGKFRKYLNNRTAVPFYCVDEVDQTRALFLSFSQHYQYFRAFKMLFVSDYSGGSTLLTDPQIMSAPEFSKAGKHLFADGNVSTGFASFEVDHMCNHFCHFFKLPTDYAVWDGIPKSVAVIPPVGSGSGVNVQTPIIIPSTGFTKAMDISDRTATPTTYV
ncbi:hypothetical protein B0H17DRAFT_1148090 [Mycena rosella]|uniref:Alpha-type protein kinase domain-containing protein n=1 Tax=Mycena rosella TaxID=1033263 RepID=A0AAD7CGR4_MYCRO|nr:hypothetical protein B0H17DRAFT_1148090 [Mycena rosella]